MKIGVVANLYHTGVGGGSEIAAQQMVSGLRTQGHQLFVVNSRDIQHILVEQVNGITVYGLPPKNLYWIGIKDSKPSYLRVVWQLLDIWNPILYRYFLQIFAEEKPDVVHTNKLRGLSVAAWTAARKLQIPIVHTAHDYETISPIGHLVGSLGEMSKNGRGPFRIYQSLRRSLSAQVDVFTAPSQFTLAFHTERGFFANARQVAIPNSHGLTNAQLHKIADEVRSVQPANNPVRYLFLGRLDTIKGIDLLLQAFDDLSREFQNVIMDVVGSGGDLEAEMESKYTHNQQIIFHGQANSEEKWNYLRQASCLVMPVTRRPAVFGLVVIEAYAAGIPVIASGIGGVSEVVEDQQTGFLIKPEDYPSLYEAMEAFAAQPELSAAMRENCLRKASDYSIEKIGEKFSEVYNMLLEKQLWTR